MACSDQYRTVICKCRMFNWTDPQLEKEFIRWSLILENDFGNLIGDKERAIFARSRLYGVGRKEGIYNDDDGYYEIMDKMKKFSEKASRKRRVEEAFEDVFGGKVWQEDIGRR